MSRVRVGSSLDVDPRFAVDLALLRNRGWDAVFGRPGPLVAEVGFGNGRYLLEMAKARPGVNFVGIELYGKGVQKLSGALAREDVANVRIIKGEGFRTLCSFFGRGDLAEFHANFPDPWPKLRHHKRRFVTPALAALLFRIVRPGGDIHLATDYDCYAFQMRDVFEAHPGFSNVAGPHRFIYEMPGRVKTKYELKFSALGATIRYLWFRRAPFR